MLRILMACDRGADSVRRISTGETDTYSEVRRVTSGRQAERRGRDVTHTFQSKIENMAERDPVTFPHYMDCDILRCLV